MDTIKSDLAGCIAEAQKMNAITSMSEMVAHLNNSLWPFIQNLVDEVTEIDGCVGDLIEGSDDILQPETAKLFAAVAIGGLVMTVKLKELSPMGKDPELDNAIAEYEKVCAKAQEAINECVIASDEDELEDDEDLEEEDDDDDDDDEDDGDEDDDDETDDEGDGR